MGNAFLNSEIIKQLDVLPYEQQRRVFDFTSALALSTPKGVPGQRLLRFAGAIDAEDLQTMTQAIEADCERMDLNEW